MYCFREKPFGEVIENRLGKTIWDPRKGKRNRGNLGIRWHNPSGRPLERTGSGHRKIEASSEDYKEIATAKTTEQ